MSRLARRAAARERIVDEFFESYLLWREACEDLRTAYEWWGRCASSQRIVGFKG